MLTSSTPQRLLGVLAAASLLSVALPATGAWAQEGKIKTPVNAAAETTPPEFHIDIPTLETEGSNVDDAVLRDVLDGNVTDNADALAGLTADSISIPEINITVQSVVEGEEVTAEMSVTDIELTDVVDGVAGSLTVGGSTFSGGEQATGTAGVMSASAVDIGGILSFYGLVDRSGDSELKTLYRDVRFEGASFEAPEGSCTFGAMTMAEFKARPLETSFVDLMGMVTQLEGDKEPSPEMLGKLVRIYADMFQAFESSPIEWEGFDCSFDDVEQVTFSIGSMTMGGFRPGIYPGYSLSDVLISVEGDDAGTINLGSVTFKQMDLSGPIAAVQSAPAALTETWFAENARLLIPAFEGFSLADVTIDIPDPEAPDSRIKGSLDAFDVTLLNYINSVPADVSMRMDGLSFDLPKDSDDEQVQTLIDLGVTNLDASFALAASWNEAENTIDIKEVSVSGQDLMNFVFSGTITNATEALFDIDPNNALFAAMDLAIRNLKVDVTDQGLSDIIFQVAAAEQGSDPATMRPVFAGLAQGSIIGMLAGATEAQEVGLAVADFVNGKAKRLTIDMTAKEPAGVSFPDFAAAETNPALLVDKVTIKAKAR